MADTAITPTTVHIQWSEAGGDLGQDRIMPFSEFEAAAAKAAAGHTTGGYLKTMVTVQFDSGDAYECRLDLGAHEPCERGFAHGIRQRIKYFESAAGRRRMAEWPESMRLDWERKYDLWKRMDFGDTERWWLWEIEDLRQPIDGSFCTLTTRH